MSAFAALAEHPHVSSGPTVFASASTLSNDRIRTFLQTEQALSANCFTFNAPKITEGLVLHLSYPGVTTPAMIMGEGRWVLRDTKPGRGCLFQKDRDDKGLVRRAVLTSIESAKGRTFNVLSRFEGDAPYTLVHVDASLPHNVRPKLELCSAIVGDIVEKAGSEALVRLTDENPIFVFRKDGGVWEITAGAFKVPVAQECSMENAFNHRLAYVQDWLERASKIEDKGHMAKSEDRACYELLNMLALLNRMGSKMEDQMCELVDRLVDLRNEGTLRRQVREKLLVILNNCSDTVRWRYNAYDNIALKDDVVLTPEQQQQKVARLAKQAQNRQLRADQNRSHQKGPSPAVDKTWGRKKGDKKK